MINKIEKIMLIYQELENNDEFKKLAIKAFQHKKEFFDKYPEFKKPFSIICKEKGFMPQFAGVSDDDNPNYFYFFEPHMYYENTTRIPVILKNDIFFISVSSESTIIIEKSFLEKMNSKEMTDEEACHMCVAFFLGLAKEVKDEKIFLYNLADQQKEFSYKIKYERIFLNELREGDQIIDDDKLKTRFISINSENIKGVLYYITSFEKIVRMDLKSIMAWTPIFK